MTRKQILCFGTWLVLALFAAPCRAADPKTTPSSPPRITHAIYQAAHDPKTPHVFSVIRAPIDPTTGRRIASRAHAYPYAINGTDIFTLSPDGSKLVVSINRVDPFPGVSDAVRNSDPNRYLQSVLDDLAVLDFTTGIWKRLTRDNAGYTDVAWSSDSKSIAYVSARGVDIPWPPDGRGAEWRVYAQNVRTGKRHTVFQENHGPKVNPRPDRHPLRWLPGSSRLLYASDDPEGLFLLDAQGAKPVLLSEHIPDLISVAKRRIVWLDEKTSADNQEYLAATIHTALFPSDLSAIKTAKQWSNLPGMKTYFLPTSVVDIVVSPDGSRLTFMSSDTTGKLGIPVVIDLSNLTVSRLGSFATGGGDLSWSQNGHFLLHLESEFFNPGKGNKVIAIPATGGQWQPLAKVDWKLPVAPLKTNVVLDLPETGNAPFAWQEAK